MEHPAKTTEDKVINSIAKGTEWIGWLRIVASPFLIGVVLAALVYVSHPGAWTLLFAGVLALAGLVVGIVWANKQMKGKGTVFFLSRIMANPEVDKMEQEAN